MKLVNTTGTVHKDILSLNEVICILIEHELIQVGSLTAGILSVIEGLRLKYWPIMFDIVKKCKVETHELQYVYNGCDIAPDGSIDFGKVHIKKDELIRYLKEKEFLYIKNLEPFLRSPEKFDSETSTESGPPNSTPQMSNEVKDPKQAQKSERGKNASNVRWEQTRQYKEKVRSYALGEIQKGCICNHIQLAKHIYEEAMDEQGKYLLDGAADIISEKQINETIKLLFSDENIKRIKGVHPSSGHEYCPVHAENDNSLG